MDDNNYFAETEESSAAGAVRLDPALTLALAQASLAAYADFERKPFVSPPNYRFVGRFTGWDDWFGTYGVEERFGLIFKYTVPGTINRFIIAFRGTDSLADAYSDAFWDLTAFQPFRNSVVPAAQVSSGFYGIYSGLGGTMTQSMQQQIFGALPVNPSEVLITGHSLGGALSQLFTLDMRASLPNAAIKTVNFASPRVGDGSFLRACQNAGADGRITRVINTWDIVPHFPTEYSHYVSVGAQFEVCFDRANWWDFNLLSDHSMLNHQTVLTNCVYLNPQIWTGTFEDAVDSNYWMISSVPPKTAGTEWIDKLKDFAAFKKSFNEQAEDSAAEIIDG